MTAAAQEFSPVRYSLREAAALADRLEGLPAREILSWALGKYGSRLVIASSFSLEDVVLIHIAASIDPSVRVFTLDTGRLHQETYDVIDAVRERLGVGIEVVAPKHRAVQRMVMAKGPNSFYASVDNRKECCAVRKVEPLKRVLATADAWVTGMRRQQSVTRTDLRPAELDLLNGGLLKLNPLVDWTSTDVRAWVDEHELPYNTLFDRGFTSVGCAPCTRAVKPGEDERAGRWWWESADMRECGLHK